MNEIDVSKNEGDVRQVSDLVKRYQACTLRIWRLFPSDCLPADDQSHFWVERLESILDHGLLISKTEATNEP